MMNTQTPLDASDEIDQIERLEAESVNAAWKRFADENMNKSPTHYVGDNYLSICHAVVGEDAEMATRATEGIRAVIDGDTDEYFLEYPCHSPTQNAGSRCVFCLFL